MFREKAIEVNSLLMSMGKEIIQCKQYGGQPPLYGYKPQYLLDAVNEVFGPENWYFELHETQVIQFSENGESGQVIAKVEVFMRASEDQEFFSHGIQFGQSNIVHGNIGDATKGAITDGLGKGFSLFSIGSMAYRGELEAIYNGNEQPAPVQEPESPQASQPAKEEGLPELPNVSFEQAGNGLIFARGDTYNNRNLLKRLGFRWHPEHKAWGLEAAA